MKSTISSVAAAILLTVSYGAYHTIESFLALLCITDRATLFDAFNDFEDFEASAKAGANNAGELAKINKEFADNANKLTAQMENLAQNLESLNNVYGGVLSAMNKK